MPPLPSHSQPAFSDRKYTYFCVNTLTGTVLFGRHAVSKARTLGNDPVVVDTVTRYHGASFREGWFFCDVTASQGKGLFVCKTPFDAVLCYLCVSASALQTAIVERMRSYFRQHIVASLAFTTHGVCGDHVVFNPCSGALDLSSVHVSDGVLATSVRTALSPHFREGGGLLSYDPSTPGGSHGGN